MSRVYSRCYLGLEPYDVTVEADPTTRGSQITGLPTEAAARESRVRVQAALCRLDIDVSGGLPDVQVYGHKGGPCAHLDLPIACAVLKAMGVQTSPLTRNAVLIGELALDGQVRPVRGLAVMLRLPCVRALVPAENAVLVPNENAVGLGIRHLRELVSGDFVRFPAPVAPPPRSGFAGIVLVGPPGCGATLASRVIAQAMPVRLSPETEAIYSVAGLPPPVAMVPFRAPHHSVSEAGLVGGGAFPRPGEVSLAHGGVLLLDEITEFRLSCLAALFAAVKAGQVTHRAEGQPVTFPAAPALVIGASAPGPRLDKLVERFGLAQVHLDGPAGIAAALQAARR